MPLVPRLEDWKPVVGWDIGYQVSSVGRVRSVDRVIERRDGVLQPLKGKILSQRIDHKTRYHSVLLSDLERRLRLSVHRMVLEAFIGPCPDGMECRHKDGNRSNNVLSNLCWGTKVENATDRLNHGTNNHGERNGGAKLTVEDVTMILLLRRRGRSVEVLSNMYGVSEKTIYNVLSGKKWGRVTGL